MTYGHECNPGLIKVLKNGLLKRVRRVGSADVCEDVLTDESLC